MVMTESTMLPLGTTATDFNLLEPMTGNAKSLADVRKENGVLVAFLSNHCPFVKHIAKELGELGEYLASKGIGMVGISANDVYNYPEDAPELMAKNASSVWKSFPYLFDESQDIAKTYKAACTPDFYLFDKDLKLYYRGQLDRSRPGNRITPDGSAIRAAADRLVAGESMAESEMRPSIGCNIKWKANNAPDYFG